MLDKSQPEIDTSAVTDYFQRTLDWRGNISIQPRQTGVNDIFDVTHEDSTYILQRPTSQRIEPFFLPLQTEYTILTMLEDSSIPTPSVITYCDDPSIIGEEFILKEYLPGDAVLAGTKLPDRFQTPVARSQICQELVKILADIHSLTPECDTLRQTTSLRDTPAKRLETFIDAYTDACSRTGRTFPGVDKAIEWLNQNIPEYNETTIVHGDLKPDNTILGPAASPTITGVIDWELCWIGDPFADLGFLLSFWFDPTDTPIQISDITDKYSDHEYLHQVKEIRENGFWSFTQQPGAYSRNELIQSYINITDRSPTSVEFYRILAILQVTAIWETWYANHQETESNTDTPFEVLVPVQNNRLEAILSHD
ncbi:MAG: phosphotransferase family protein [Halobacteriaceae archaeon]